MSLDDARGAGRLTRAGSLLALGACALLLTGCFDVLQELWLEPGGPARTRIEVRLPRTVLALSRVQGGRPLEELQEQANQRIEALRGEPGVRQLAFTLEEGPSSVRLEYTLEVDDARQLGALQRRFLEGVSGAVPGEVGSLELWDLEITRPGMGRLALRKRLAGANPDPTPPATDADWAGEALGLSLAAALFADHALTVRVHGPRIVSTNGEVDASGQRVEWRVPLAQLLDRSFGQQLEVEVGWRFPRWLWFALGALGVFVVGLLLGRSGSGRRGG